MIRVCLFLSLFLPAAFAEQKPSSPIRQERETLIKLAAELENFFSAADSVDRSLQALRAKVRARKFKEAEEMAPEIWDQVRRLRRHWPRIEEIYDTATKNGLDLNRLVHNDLRGEHPHLDDLVAMKVNNRFDHGSPVELLLRTGRALYLGEKVDKLPRNLRDAITDDTPIKHGDYILAFLNNGGLIRGRLEGWSRDGGIVLRETMPLAYVRYQKKQGPWRVLSNKDWDEISSLEIFRMEKRSSSSVTPMAAAGGYTAAALAYDTALVAEIQPADMELLKAARGRRLESLRLNPQIKPLDREVAVRPRFPETIFPSCDSQLN